jgi:hypothetical protein
MKVAVVAAPTYFARCPPPRTPDDLGHHECIQFRRGSDGAIFDWAFERSGRSRRISGAGRLTVNDARMCIRAAVDGLGVAYTIEALAEPFLRSGQLVRVLEDWSPCLDGMFLYYPGHRQVPAPLRALIDMIRVSSSAPARKRPALANPFCGQACEVVADGHGSRDGSAAPQEAPAAAEPRMPYHAGRSAGDEPEELAPLSAGLRDAGRERDLRQA